MKQAALALLLPGTHLFQTGVYPSHPFPVLLLPGPHLFQSGSDPAVPCPWKASGSPCCSVSGPPGGKSCSGSCASACGRVCLRHTRRCGVTAFASHHGRRLGGDSAEGGGGKNKEFPESYNQLSEHVYVFCFNHSRGRRENDRMSVSRCRQMRPSCPSGTKPGQHGAFALWPGGHEGSCHISSRIPVGVRPTPPARGSLTPQSQAPAGR